jgi:hypothetical protein
LSSNKISEIIAGVDIHITLHINPLSAGCFYESTLVSVIPMLHTTVEVSDMYGGPFSGTSTFLCSIGRVNFVSGKQACQLAVINMADVNGDIDGEYSDSSSEKGVYKLSQSDLQS